jgi:phenylalanyl-tRNA synthetase beta chain
MKISYQWLARHVDLSGLTAQDVAQDFTLSTAEVEGVERFLPHLDAVVVGRVLEREKHPDADKLSVCKVDVGLAEPQQIVCGAPNVRAGLHVAVALPGTRLPGDLHIKKSKIRGVESCGMICSERELGLGEEHDGIWELPLSTKPGAPVAQELGLVDWIIEIDNKSLTHRPDLWGHRGLAREIAAMRKRPLKPLDPSPLASGSGAATPVEIRSAGCLRYIAVPIDGVAPRRSPDWLRALLFAVGARPIDLLVDLSNFVMHDLGQPNHCFDRAKLAGRGIVVRDARADERLLTLDGIERRLSSGDMLICAGDEPVALAGVMGGEGSKVQAGTDSLLLEVACFQPAVVRRTAQRLALRTDSSTRFEKHLDPTLPAQAAAHFVRLLKEIEPAARVAGAIADVGAWRDPAREVHVRPERVRRLLGVDLSDARIAEILASLDFGVSAQEGELVVSVPSRRATKDIGIEQDLVEEVGRIHRYGNIPTRPLVAPVEPPPRDEGWRRRMLVRAVQDRLARDARLLEALSYSFVSDALLEQLSLSALPHVAVVNPVAEGFSRIRRGVLGSVLEKARDNRHHAERVALFEVGKGYLPEQANARGEPREVHECAIVLALPPSKEQRSDGAAWTQVRAIVEDLLAGLGHERAVAGPAQACEPCAHPIVRAAFRSADGAHELAVAMALDPVFAQRLGFAGDLKSDVACAVVSIDALLSAASEPRGYQPLPRFPGVKVDVAVVVPDAVPAARCEELLARSGKGLVRALEVFDVYRGGVLPPQARSLAWHVELRADDKTLGEAEVQKFLERVERALGEIGCTLRRQ